MAYPFPVCSRVVSQNMAFWVVVAVLTFSTLNTCSDSYLLFFTFVVCSENCFVILDWCIPLSLIMFTFRTVEINAACSFEMLQREKGGHSKNDSRFLSGSNVPSGGDVFCVRLLWVHTATRTKIGKLQQVVLQLVSKQIVFNGRVQK